MSNLDSWVGIAANLVTVAVAVAGGVATAMHRARKWLTANVSEKLDGLAQDVRKLASEQHTLSARLDAHIRDHDSHRRTWRF